MSPPPAPDLEAHKREEKASPAFRILEMRLEMEASELLGPLALEFSVVGGLLIV